jgi:hypothetical protein
MIDRHLNLVSAKSQTAELLMKLRLMNEALARSAPPALPAPRPSVTLAPWPAHEDRPNLPTVPANPQPASFSSPIEDDAHV